MDAREVTIKVESSEYIGRHKVATQNPIVDRDVMKP